jgi:hypothetical protein
MAFEVSFHPFPLFGAVRSFLLTIRRERGRKQAAMDSPSATRDDEQALYVLKTNSFDTQKALDLIHTSDAFITEAITPWSEEECRQFELGMKKFGKNFNEIKKLVSCHFNFLHSPRDLILLPL